MFGIGLNIEINGNLNIDSFEVEIECPHCVFFNPIRIKQARLRETIICRGCKNNIRLDDSMNTVRKARRRLLGQFNQLKRQLDRINRISW